MNTFQTTSAVVLPKQGYFTCYLEKSKLMQKKGLSCGKGWTGLQLKRFFVFEEEKEQKQDKEQKQEQEQDKEQDKEQE